MFRSSHDDEPGPAMQIVLYPHPALRWRAKPIREINARVRSAVREMFDLMYESRGVGLAGNQVGLPWRVFVVNVTGDPEQRDEEFVFINPEILRRNGSAEDDEGCLSLPELFGPVRRPERVVVEAFDLDGQLFEMDLRDLPARVIQHEYDHLDGVLFTDRMAPADRRELEPHLAAFEDRFRRMQAAGECPSDDELKRQLRDLEP